MKYVFKEECKTILVAALGHIKKWYIKLVQMSSFYEIENRKFVKTVLKNKTILRSSLNL